MRTCLIVLFCVVLPTTYCGAEVLESRGILVERLQTGLSHRLK